MAKIRVANFPWRIGLRIHSGVGHSKNPNAGGPCLNGPPATLKVGHAGKFWRESWTRSVGRRTWQPRSLRLF